MKICFYANDQGELQGVRKFLFGIKYAMFNWRLTEIANDRAIVFLRFG